MHSINPLIGTATILSLNATNGSGLPSETCTRRISLDAELAIWADSESSRMGMTFGSFIATLLEWARTEEITSDLDLGLFMAPVHHDRHG